MKHLFVPFMMALAIAGLAIGCPRPGGEMPPAVVLSNCQLRRAPILPVVDVAGGGEGGCPDAFAVCVDATNTARLDVRELRMRQWIRESCSQCGCGLADGGAHDQ